jgi:hypothetical protein
MTECILWFFIENDKLSSLIVPKKEFLSIREEHLEKFKTLIKSKTIGNKIKHNTTTVKSFHIEITNVIEMADIDTDHEDGIIIKEFCEDMLSYSKCYRFRSNSDEYDNNTDIFWYNKWKYNMFGFHQSNDLIQNLFLWKNATKINNIDIKIVEHFVIFKNDRKYPKIRELDCF